MMMNKITIAHNHDHDENRYEGASDDLPGGCLRREHRGHGHADRHGTQPRTQGKIRRALSKCL